MKIFDKNLTNRSIMTLQVIMDAIDTKNEVIDLIIACHHAGLIKYNTTDDLTKRFGSRCKKSNELSVILRILNGMANRIEELEKLNKNE